jgi:hypothetical protein
MSTWENLLVRYYLLAVFAGGVVLWVVWRLARRISNPSLRALARAMCAAFVFTPAIVPVSEIGGAVPAPASWMFFYGIFGRDGRGFDTALGGSFILAATITLWFVFGAVGRKRSHHEENA